MDRLYGGVCYAGIDVDPDLKYPKGAGRVAFSNQQSYIAAITARFAHLQHGDIDKRVSFLLQLCNRDRHILFLLGTLRGKFKQDTSASCSSSVHFFAELHGQLYYFQYAFHLKFNLSR